MQSRKKTLLAIWEGVPDRDYQEKLRQAFAIILGSDTFKSVVPAFDETEILEQDESAAKELGSLS